MASKDKTIWILPPDSAFTTHASSYEELNKSLNQLVSHILENFTEFSVCVKYRTKVQESAYFVKNVQRKVGYGNLVDLLEPRDIVIGPANSATLEVTLANRYYILYKPFMISNEMFFCRGALSEVERHFSRAEYAEDLTRQLIESHNIPDLSDFYSQKTIVDALYED